MTEEIDQHFLDHLDEWEDVGPPASNGDGGLDLDAAGYLAYFEAQVESRHLDFAARWLQSQGHGFYTIGSAGHESNAAVALALRPTDPALLHYRSGGFYAARAAQVPGTTPIHDVLAGMASSVDDPISGGRHKVFGHAGLNIIPQTSTIGSHLPRAVGVAYAIGRAARTGTPTTWEHDAVVVTSFGDASANHSTVTGALNTAGYCAHRGLDLPLLIVCEDNGIGISTRTPDGWTAAQLSSRPGLGYVHTDGARPHDVMIAALHAVDTVRTTRRPVVLHLSTVRFMGHAGSDLELGYRSRADIRRDYESDPLLATAALLVGREILTVEQVRRRYEEVRAAVMEQAERMCRTRRLETPEQVMAPLTRIRRDAAHRVATQPPEEGARASVRERPEEHGALTLAQSINASLGDVLAVRPEAMVFGEDVARKGGVYGVTRGLSKRFGHDRVFDSVLDEQSILGMALGTAVSGSLPIPEIQYLAYVHNAEDQLRGEAATLSFFSAGQYTNGMVVRIAGLAYQKGFGGHFHNDNSVAVLRDIPGLVVVVPSHPAEAPELLRACVGLASAEGRVCVVLEPIALYHAKDLHEAGDGLWTAPYDPPARWVTCGDSVGRVAVHGSGNDLLLITFGNGVPMSLRAAARLRGKEVDCTVLDLRWLSPLPMEDLMDHVTGFDRVLVVDETRHSGGVSESVVAGLVDQGYEGLVRRMTSEDSVVPLGPAADTVLLSVDDIVATAQDLTTTNVSANRVTPTDREYALAADLAAATLD